MYYLFLLLLYPISLLPLWFLYLCSNVFSFLLLHVIGYRKEIVLKNLAQSFPEKSSKEIKKIRRKFYISFMDQWFETLKLLSISKRDLNKRIVSNYEVFNDLHAEGKDVFVLLGHQFNWEWGNVTAQYNSKAQFAGIYLSQNNKVFDRLMLKIRSRTGTVLIEAQDMRAGFSKLKEDRYIISFMADQTPANINIADWYLFMNRPAPFFKAPEKAARRAKAAVVFAGLEKIKRGKYHLKLQLVSKNAAMEENGFITRSYVAFLEKELRSQPENWMWTHRRWKKTMPNDAILKN